MSLEIEKQDQECMASFEAHELVRSTDTSHLDDKTLHYAPPMEIFLSYILDNNRSCSV